MSDLETWNLNLKNIVHVDPYMILIMLLYLHTELRDIFDNTFVSTRLRSMFYIYTELCFSWMLNNKLQYVAAGGTHSNSPTRVIVIWDIGSMYT